MSALKNAVEGLFGRFGSAIERPSPNEIWFLEVGPDIAVDGDGRFRVRREELRSFEDYDGRFEELLRSGLPWLNVGFYGKLEGRTVVGVEVPRKGNAASPRTSINYSGPTKGIAEAKGNFSGLIRIE